LKEFRRNFARGDLGMSNSKQKTVREDNPAQEKPDVELFDPFEHHFVWRHSDDPFDMFDGRTINEDF
jgi:hypothetical protein